MKIILGIDNGVSGASVALEVPCGRLIAYWDAPVIVDGNRKQLWCEGMYYVLERAAEMWECNHVFIERGQPMPKSGSIAMFQAGQSDMGWRMACRALLLPYTMVAPRTWQASMLRDVPGSDTKARSLMRASQLFPALPLMKPNGRKPTLDGRADAALIARYGLNQLAQMEDR